MIRLMNKDAWRQNILSAVAKYQQGDSQHLELLAQLLDEQDTAKQMLRSKGYGCTGMGWIDTVNEVGHAEVH